MEQDEDERDMEDDKSLDSLGAYYMKLGHNDEMIFNELGACFKVDLEPTSMFVVELRNSEHTRPDVIEAKQKKLDNLSMY